MKTVDFRICFLLIIGMLASGCSTVWVSKTDKMYILGGALVRLTASVESAVAFKNPPESLRDEELLAFSTQHDPSLLTPFREYRLKVLRQDNEAVLLICTVDGQVRLLEDAGCTAELDRHWWRDDPGKPCDFTVNVGELCLLKESKR